MAEKSTYADLEQRIRLLEAQVTDLKKRGASADSALLARLPVMAHAVDREGVIVEVSTMWIEKMGYTRGEVVGRRSTDFLTEESRAYALERGMPLFLDNGFIENVPYRFVRKDGQILDVLLSAIMLVDAAGAFERSLAIITDISKENRIRSSPA